MSGRREFVVRGSWPRAGELDRSVEYFSGREERRGGR